MGASATLLHVLLPLVLAVAAAGPATPPAELLAALGPVDAKVGAWAEYLVRSRGQRDLRIRVSAVPPVLEDGRAWVEVASVGGLGLPFAARLLVSDTGRLERALVYALGQAPLEIPIGEIGERRTAERKSPKPGARAEHRRSSQVTVPAGVFHAEELRVLSGHVATRIWRAANVPLWKLVRAEGRHQTVELIGYGHQGARSVFPGAQGNGSDSAK